MRTTALRVALAGTLATAVAAGVAVAAASRDRAGPRPDGTALTPTGYWVTPAGAQRDLGDLPLSAALSPDGRRMLVSNDGQGVQSLQVVDTSAGAVIQTIPYRSPEALYAGVAYSPDGRRAYASAGGNNKVRGYDVAADGRLTETGAIPLPTKNPAGMPITPFPAGLAVTPDGKRLVVADQLADAVTVVDLADKSIATVAVGHRPYGVTLSRDGGTAYVANQGAGTVSAVALGAVPADLKVTGTIAVGAHPNKSVLDRAGRALYVADGDSDQVSVIDTRRGAVVRAIALAPYPGAQVGANPDGLALSPDERALYVANAGNNDVAVIDLRSGRVRGLIPTGWYPTAVLAHADRLLVTNAKGLGAGPNNGPGQPDPTSTAPTDPAKYAGSMMAGTLSTLAVPTAGELARYTRQVRGNDGFDARGQAPGGGSQVIPRHPGQRSPIKHVIYVVRENRTYDQVLGSVGKGDGDPALTLFGEESAPNARELARRFGVLDNFYADAEISAQGWNWAVAANSNAFAEQTWPANYSGRNAPYPSESDEPAIAPNKSPDDAYIWQRLAQRNVSFRNYGFYVDTDAAGRSVAGDPVLNARTDPRYRGYDLKCPDSAAPASLPGADCGTARIDEWQREFGGYVSRGDLPAVELVRLPNDHTAGTRAGSPTPRAYVADNDRALGKLVDAVSHSPYWPSTAIFVTEDDAQNGPDHVDAHRTVSLAISPYTQHGGVDSTFYSTASMLRTIELLVGLGPLTQFDAFATPLIGSFTDQPDPRPYDAITPAQPVTAVNTAASPLAAVSGRQDLSKEDRIDEQQFNLAIWRSVKGAGAPMPAPRHNVILRAPTRN